MVNKIAFLFLTIDNTRFPEIWEYYFRGNEDKINIYVHPKNKELVTDSFLRDNIIDDLRETKWGLLVDAELELFKSAFKDKDNKYFILLSESCLPIKSFNSLYSFLSTDNLSYLKLRNEDETNDTIDYLFEKKDLGNYFDKNYNFVKHSQWCCLSRYHVEKLVNNKLVKKFINVHTGDELFMSVLFPDDNIKDFEINYSDWSNKTKANELTKEIKELWIKYDNSKGEEKNNILKRINKLIKLRKEYGAHPKTYEEIDLDVIKEIHKLDAFFLRKFGNNSNILDYYKILLSNN